MAAGRARSGPPVFIFINPTCDFFHADGAVKTFSTARAARSLVELYRAVRKASAPVILVRDVHASDDKEFAETGLPTHGVAGMSVAEFIPELREPGTWAIPPTGKRRPWIDAQAWRAGKAPVILEKNALDTTTNPALEELLRGVPSSVELAVCGALIEFDVTQTLRSLKFRGFHVTLAVGATAARDEAAEIKAQGEAAALGVHCEPSAEIVLRVRAAR